MKAFQTYPDALHKLEADAIAIRRLAADLPAVESGHDDRVGLCLSGGGIRSATFCLGFLQAMAGRRLIRRVDWLSTVSGGGYIGTFLGRFYDRLRTTNPPLPHDAVEQALTNPSSRELRWLRQHGEYLAPAGRSDLIYDVAIFVRNFLTLHLVLGALLAGLYATANAVRYGLLEKVAAALPYVGGIGWQDLPIGYLVNQAKLGVFWSPWFMLVELFVLLAVLPKAIGYWLASQDEVEAFSRPTLILVFATATALLWAGVQDGLKPTLILLALPCWLSFVSVELAWRRVRRVNEAAGTGGTQVEQLRARIKLTRDLAFYLAFAAGLFYFALVDTIGHAVFEAYAQKSVAFSQAIATLGGGLLALLPILRGGAVLIANHKAQRPNPGLLARVIANPLVASLVAAALMLPPLVLVAYIGHAVFFISGGKDNQPDLPQGLITAGSCLAASIVLAFPAAMPLVNRSSLQSSYAARLARAYLGASNPRHSDENLDEVMPGDDVNGLPSYRPHEAGGPLHLINSCINQTIDYGSLRSARARQGVGLTCSPIGVTVSKFYHAVWTTRGGQLTVDPIGHVMGTPHPLLGADDQPPDAIESLPLRDWMAISGAAFGTGLGQANNAALSILFLLANLRTGYWWNSGLSAGDRGTRPDVSFFRRLMWLLAVALPTQSRLLDEATGRFAGPWDKFWYLSDGGHFENLGGYEMIRRQVPHIIMVDATADVDYDFDDFANFERKIRIDFNAELEPFSQTQWDNQTSADIASYPAAQQPQRVAFWQAISNDVAVQNRHDGPFDQILTHATLSKLGRAVPRHAFLFRVRYHADIRGEPCCGSRTSLLLYVKASLDGDEPIDIKNYYTENPDFPHESTAEQSFNEAQWESYRKLGQYIGDEVFGLTGRGEPLWLTLLK